MYLTFDDYVILNGTAATEEEFPMLEFKARKRLDYLTDCRIQAMAKVPEAVRMCMVSMINIEAKAGAEAQLSSPQVSSFTTDGYSESYKQAPGISEVQQEQDKLVRSMLYGELDDTGVPLLYRGLY